MASKNAKAAAGDRGLANAASQKSTAFVNSQKNQTAQAAAEWRAIREFAAECRRLWPGATIILRANETNEFAQSARIPAGASGNPETEIVND
jgi:hypothetical protein